MASKRCKDCRHYRSK